MRAITASLALALALLPGVSLADNQAGEDELVIAMLDTGLRPSHQEFVYGGPDDPNDQIVGWWDFTEETMMPRLPGPGQRWDPRVPDMFDDNGHGTATASMAAGLNVDPAKQPSFAPGAKLAVARVCIAEGNCPGNIPAAIRWATETMDADVINISISSTYPTADYLTMVHEAAGIAREAGVLTVVANGNGVFGSGLLPGSSTVKAFADSPNVFGVGASDEVFQLATTWDPEVVARFSVRAAAQTCDACYRDVLGTSFASPLVAGMAARAMAEARAHGIDPTPDYIETLLKYAARDTPMPPTIEGFGVLDADTMPEVLTHAAAGSVPVRPDPDPNALYVDHVGGTVRDLVANKADADTRALYPTGIDAANGAGILDGPSGYAGLKELEIYTIDVPAGGWVDAAALVGDSPATAVGLRAYRGTDPILRNRDLVAISEFTNDYPSRLWFRAPAAGTYRLVVELNLGFGLGLAPQPFTLNVDADAEAVFASEGYYVALATPLDDLF